jgi:hypothetical protein
MVVPSTVVNIAKIVLDITIKCSGSLHGDAGRRCVRQNTIGLEAIGIFY